MTNKFNSGDRVILYAEIIEDLQNEGEVYIEVDGIVDSYPQIYVRRDKIRRAAENDNSSNNISLSSNSVVFVGAGC